MLVLYLIIIVAGLLKCHGAPISRSVGENSADVIELSSDAGILKRIFDDTVEVFDKETLLLYKPDAVYQINLPQKAVETSEVVLNTESPYDLLKSLESSDHMTLEEFTQLSGIEGNAQLVFNDWDSNGDGFLDRHEILQEEMKEETN